MLVKKELDKKELFERISLNFDRLLAPYYQIGEVFQEKDADWPGDKEGRALLAFVSHYKINGKINPCMEQMLSECPARMNEYLYFGPVYDGNVIFEQQLSGHSWLLRGLCEHYEQFKDDFSLKVLRSVTEHLFLPLKGRFASYPVDRDRVDEGAVSGNSTSTLNGWRLSTDIGCAFMSIDGLSHVYCLTDDARVLELIDEMIDVYVNIDKIALRAQTHCTLTAARGMMRLFCKTGDGKYLENAKKIYELYVHGGGMSLTYQNLNWWARPDTWTEPCAIVDSLMLATELYLAEKKEEYRTVAARIWHNGLASAQRPCGGAGTDSVVLGDQRELYMSMYEAPFCCTMRLAEGLWYAKEHCDLLWAAVELDGDGAPTVSKDCSGRYMSGDIMYAEITGCKMRGVSSICVDGHELFPLLKYYRLNPDELEKIKQRVIFD